MDRLLEEVNLYKMEMQKPEETLLENELAMKEMTRSFRYLDRIWTVWGQRRVCWRRKTKHFFLFIAGDYERQSDYREVAESIVFIFEKAVLKYCSWDVFELLPFIMELRRNWKRISKEVEKADIHQKDGTMFVHSSPFLECKLYTQYTLSVGNAGQCLFKIAQYETRR